MNSKFAAAFMAVVLLFAVVGAAQTSAPAAPATTAPATTSAPAPAAAQNPVVSGSQKFAVINMRIAILGTNEGQRDLAALETKFTPKSNELQSASKELEDLRKQLQAQDGKLNEEARTSLVKSIEQKQKVFQRNSEDAQNDYTQQQNEIVQKILQKLAPVVRKYANDNNLALLIDVSDQWPQSPVLWVRESVDITKPVVDAYNAQSGVPPPPRPATTGTPGGGAGRTTTPARPAGPAGTTAPKPKPQTTTPPPR
jgi:Skp family chaperone for outer membrane proteins